jgi:hypothetical protein
MWSLRGLIGICVWFGIRGLGIAWTTLDELERYRSLNAAGSPVLRIGINGLAGMVLLVVAWGLWQRRRWAYQVVVPVLAGVMLFNGIWLAVYAQTDFDQKRIAFVAVTSTLLMGFITWLHWRVRKIFGENHDEQSRKEWD